MSADFNTVITITGKEEELLLALRKLQSYAEMNEHEGRCGYFTSVWLSRSEHSLSDVMSIEDASDSKISALIDELKGKLFVHAGGPYGRFGSLIDTTFAYDLAKVAPKTTFSGYTIGFGTDGEEHLDFSYSKGKLSLVNWTPSYEDYEMDEDEEEDDQVDWDAEDGFASEGWTISKTYDIPFE